VPAGLNKTELLLPQNAIRIFTGAVQLKERIKEDMKCVSEN
jgi:hypothetical protein